MLTKHAFLPRFESCETCDMIPLLTSSPLNNQSCPSYDKQNLQRDTSVHSSIILPKYGNEDILQATGPVYDEKKARGQPPAELGRRTTASKR